jgi:hypothetical protein
MNKTKFLALFAFSAIFFACGSQDGSPPSLKSNNLTISPFDTLKVEFDSRIANVNEEDIIISTSTGKVTGYNNNVIYFIGNNNTLGGSHYFVSGSSESITFKKLENSDGYKRDSTTFHFSTHQILDDLEGNNDEQGRAKDLEPFFANIKTITFAGVLDHKIAASKFNMEDYYKINMRMNDTLIISASSKDTLTINITEPSENSVDKIIGVSAKREKKDTLIIGSGHLTGDDQANKPADFYIKIYDSNSGAPPNPYTLTIKKQEYHLW